MHELGSEVTTHSSPPSAPPRRLRRARLAPVGAFVVVAVLAAGCSSNSSSSTTSSSANSSTTTTAGLSKAAVRVLQVALAKVGCYSGSVDGTIGSLTTQAVRAFQSASGLPVDGVYGSNTQRKLLAAQTAGTKVCSTSTSTSTTAPVTTTTSTAGTGAPAAATAAVNSYEVSHGPAAGTWQITSAQASTVDPTYVLFRIGPAPGHENDVQGGYGFVHNQGGTWTVIGFGSSEVGCPPGSSGNVIVPTAVLAGFGVSCPSTS